ncbi:FKBP-type peptidyl-prolyl cis-trans isomerase [Nocardioides sp. 1609]|uniref:FKBP-type peptidyl-prolyl cis-trans isomerase n=1 Tax=Nocardioides sp. 1609 TaxID=2508327 RepID=UPI00106FF1ED|nr:FKBP-type peptidyl-prolyl cis-trans isomerase [Nocardioides sp. 1609]
MPLIAVSGLLAACGSDVPGNGIEFADRLDAVTIEGDVGDAPTIEWKNRMSAGAIETETLVEGDGEALADGDKVFVNFALADGFTRETAVDTFGEEAPAVEMKVGAGPAAEPQSLGDVVSGFLSEQIGTDVTRGSRIVVTGDTNAIFGDLALSPALAEENIGNEDGLLLVADVLDVEALPGIESTDQPAKKWMPTITYTKGVPTSLDFERATAPAKDDKSAADVVVEGDGDVVEKGDLIVVDYLGQAYDGKKPFDESFSKEPFATGIGLGTVVAGWDKLLVGQKVGSRVMLKIPPADGYGDQEQNGIPAKSTLYFVVDILATV